MGQFDIANSVRWHGHVLRREGCHALDFDVEGQRMESETEEDMEEAG